MLAVELLPRHFESVAALWMQRGWSVAGLTPVDAVVEALNRVGCSPKKIGCGYKARCPAHDDRNPSLAISAGDDGRALIRCHAGCDTGAVVAAVGLSMRDLMPANGNGRAAPGERTGPTFATADDAVADLERLHGRVIGRWDYHDGGGALVGVVFRWDTANGKIIRPVALIGDCWQFKAMPEPRPLYGLAEIGANPEVLAVVVEGEKCADAVRSVGLLGVTSAGGAQAARKADWRPLAGRDVLLIPDADGPGEKYIADVGAILAKLTPAPTARILRLPGLPDGGDIVDWLAERDGQTPAALRDEILRLAADAPAVEPAAPAKARRALRLRTLADVDASPPQWCWAGRIPCAAVTMIAGSPSRGKSLVALTLAAILTQGRDFPLGTDCRPRQPRRVLGFMPEDAAGENRRRFEAAGGDPRMLTLIEGAISPNGAPEPFTMLDADLLVDELRRAGDVGLLIVDPVGLTLNLRDSSEYSGTYAAMSLLSDAAQVTGVPILAVHHRPKGAVADPLDAVLGSVAFAAACRSVLTIRDDPDDDDANPIRILEHVKASHGPAMRSIAFRIGADPLLGAGRIEWIELRDESAKALNKRARGAAKRGPEPKVAGEAVAFLRRTLALGPRPTDDVLEDGIKGEGLSRRSIERARKPAGVEGFRPAIPGPWFMRLRRPPDDDAQDRRVDRQNTP